MFPNVGAIQSVALRGHVSGIGNDAAQLFFIGAVANARGVHHIFFDQNAAHIVGAELQSHLANLDSRREPARLDVIDVVEIQPADGQRLQIIERGRLRNFFPSGVFSGAKIQGMNAVKPPVSSCMRRSRSR